MASMRPSLISLAYNGTLMGDSGEGLTWLSDRPSRAELIWEYLWGNTVSQQIEDISVAIYQVTAWLAPGMIWSE